MFFDAACYHACKSMNVRQLTARETQLIYACIQLTSTTTGNMHKYLSSFAPMDKDQLRHYMSSLVIRGYLDRTDKTFIYTPSLKSFDYVSRIKRYLTHKRLTNARRYRATRAKS